MDPGLTSTIADTSVSPRPLRQNPLAGTPRTSTPSSASSQPPPRPLPLPSSLTTPRRTCATHRLRSSPHIRRRTPRGQHAIRITSCSDRRRPLPLQVENYPRQSVPLRHHRLDSRRRSTHVHLVHGRA